MKISIIIPNFNNKSLLEKNLPIVLGLKGITEVIIVDDGSTDGSAGFIKDKKFTFKNTAAKIEFLQNEKNLGFSSTVNRGVIEASGEIVVLLNTDVTPEENFLKPLIGYFKNPKIFAVGCLDKSIERGKTVLRGRGVGEWKKGFLIHHRGEIDKTDTFWVSCGSGAFRKELWEKLGGLDELYNPFYWEDIDLSYRAQKAGYQILFEPKSVVTHKHEEGIIRKKYSPFKIKTIAYRNQFIFIWKNMDSPFFIRNHFFWLSLYVFKSIVNFDLAFLSGLLQAILKLPKVLESRRKVKKLYCKADEDILINSAFK